MNGGAAPNRRRWRSSSSPTSPNDACATSGERRTTNHHRSCRSGAAAARHSRTPKSPRDRWCRRLLVSTLSMAVFVLMRCAAPPSPAGNANTNNAPTVVFWAAEALVPNGGRGLLLPGGGCGTTIRKANNPNTAKPPPRHQWSSLAAKNSNNNNNNQDAERKTNDSSSGSSNNDGERNEPSFFGSFFRDDDDNDKRKKADDDADDSKGVPLLGRFFKTDEEKAEREEQKRLKKQEKEQLKSKQREKKREEKEQLEWRGAAAATSADNDTNKKRNKIVPAIKNYLEERQIRKDREELRSQVIQQEQERKNQAEKDADELRQEVQKREKVRKRQREEIQRKLSMNTSSSSSSAPTNDAADAAAANALSEEDIVKRKIATQKELDKRRNERVENRNAQEKSKQPETESSSSKSQRFGNVVSAAQKFVSGVFENDQKKNEQWIVVAPKTRISPGEIVAVTAGGIDLLLVASKDGSAVHCVANSCPHLGTPLEVGSLERLPIETSSSASSGGDSTDVKPVTKESSFSKENDISRMLKEDGCEDCIVCPLHKTAFALQSGEVRGEWCPYPPVIGKLTGTIKQQSNLPVFDVRTKGKNIEVRLNTPLDIGDN